MLTSSVFSNLSKFSSSRSALASDARIITRPSSRSPRARFLTRLFSSSPFLSSLKARPSSSSASRPRARILVDGESTEDESDKEREEDVKEEREGDEEEVFVSAQDSASIILESKDKRRVIVFNVFLKFPDSQEEGGDEEVEDVDADTILDAVDDDAVDDAHADLDDKGVISATNENVSDSCDDIDLDAGVSSLAFSSVQICSNDFIFIKSEGTNPRNGESEMESGNNSTHFALLTS